MWSWPRGIALQLDDIGPRVGGSRLVGIDVRGSLDRRENRHGEIDEEPRCECLVLRAWMEVASEATGCHRTNGGAMPEPLGVEAGHPRGGEALFHPETEHERLEARPAEQADRVQHSCDFRRKTERRGVDRPEHPRMDTRVELDVKRPIPRYSPSAAERQRLLASFCSARSPTRTRHVRGRAPVASR